MWPSWLDSGWEPDVFISKRWEGRKSDDSLPVTISENPKLSFLAVDACCSHSLVNAPV